ncbi:YjhG/YagF family D-xylonate dehydratase [Bacillus andreraoultii]|uniref:YjhG/YagF family D-xylonate dehydratase n=1 Tax=Bacillus andreraoultii TaxID=1499685 RepID=UPI00053AC6E3|nr:YjhG/YagF family D-xylonate dehydratase [Bacillus andreraoultii]
MSIKEIYGEVDESLYEINSHKEGPKGKLPLTPEILRNRPSGDIFGMTLNAGMGWKPSTLLGKQVLMLSTLGGIRKDDGTPIAMGLHTGHFEIGVQMEKAAEVIKSVGGVPYAAHVTDPCDGRTQGTTGMFDSLPYRNDAAIVLRRLWRSQPTTEAVLGLAACDKGLPAMMIALASMHDIPTVIVPGGSTLQATEGEDNGTVQTIGARYARGEITLEQAALEGCRACASAGGGCQFLGTAGTSQVISEGLGMALPHTALAPSSTPIWAEIGTQAARAVLELEKMGITTKEILTDKAIENAMVVHAAFGGSTNLLLHLPAIAYAAGCKVPTVEDWAKINKKVPRLVSVLPVGPVNHPTSRVFLAGGVPEVMLHLRKLGLLHEDVMTVTGHTLKENLDWWEASERRKKCQERLFVADGIQVDEVIMSPEQAKERGLTSTITFPVGNIAPEGSVVKSTAIDPSVIDDDGVFRHTGPAKVFTSEKDAIKAIKDGDIESGDIMVVVGVGPMGTGMEETYQLTSALKHLPFGKHVSLITDARFSGVSTGACFGHVGPEALAGGPLGKIQNGDIIEIIVDCSNLDGSINFIGTEDRRMTPEEGAKILAARESNSKMGPDADLPEDTRLWAALQSISGGTWRGCVYDVDRILEVIEAGKLALADKERLIKI